MSTGAATPLDPKELRPLLHVEIDRLPEGALADVHRTLLEMEVRRLADELGEALQEGWASGRVTEGGVAESIREHRRTHPYR